MHPRIKKIAKEHPDSNGHRQPKPLRQIPDQKRSLSLRRFRTPIRIRIKIRKRIKRKIKIKN